MKRVLLAAVGLMLGATACFGEDSNVLRLFPLVKPIERPESEQEEIVAVVLDADVYDRTEDLRTLRVVDDAGHEVPYRLDKATETRTDTIRQPCPSRVASLVENDDNSIEVVVRLDDKSPSADGIIFHTPLKNFERRVSVYGSDDGQEWKLLVDGKTIFDYSRYMDIAQREIALPANSYRQLKAVIQDIVDEKESALMELSRQYDSDEQTGRTERTTVLRRPLRIDRIELWHASTRELARQEKLAIWPIVDFKSEDDLEKKQTIVHVSTRREPISRFTLNTTGANFSRTVHVQAAVGEGMTSDWIDIGHGQVSLFRFRSFEQEALTVEFGEHRSREYRIVIDNADSPALEVTGIEAKGPEYQVLFFASPGAKYQLAYGSETAQPPSYDKAALSAALAQGYRPVVVTLGPEKENPQFGGPAGPDVAKLLNNPIFLGVAIGLMVIVLALLLFRAGKQIEHINQEE